MSYALSELVLIALVMPGALAMVLPSAMLACLNGAVSSSIHFAGLRMADACWPGIGFGRSPFRGFVWIAVTATCVTVLTTLILEWAIWGPVRSQAAAFAPACLLTGVSTATFAAVLNGQQALLPGGLRIKEFGALYAAYGLGGLAAALAHSGSARELLRPGFLVACAMLTGMHLVLLHLLDRAVAGMPSGVKRASAVWLSLALWGAAVRFSRILNDLSIAEEVAASAFRFLVWGAITSVIAIAVDRAAAARPNSRW